MYGPFFDTSCILLSWFITADNVTLYKQGKLRKCDVDDPANYPTSDLMFIGGAWYTHGIVDDGDISKT